MSPTGLFLLALFVSLVLHVAPLILALRIEQEHKNWADARFFSAVFLLLLLMGVGMLLSVFGAHSLLFFLGG